MFRSMLLWPLSGWIQFIREATMHLQLPTTPYTIEDDYTATAADRCDTQPSPQARKYCTTGPNTGPGLPHPTEHEPTMHLHNIVTDKQHDTCYMHGSSPSAHTPSDFV